MKHNMERSGVIQIDPQIDLFFRNDAVSFFQRQTEAFRPVSFPPERSGNEIANMPGPCPQGFAQEMPDAELTARIREYRADGKTIDSWLNACVSAAHDLNLTTWYFRVEQSADGWQIVAVFL